MLGVLEFNLLNFLMKKGFEWFYQNIGGWRWLIYYCDISIYYYQSDKNKNDSKLSTLTMDISDKSEIELILEISVLSDNLRSFF